MMTTARDRYRSPLAAQVALGEELRTIAARLDVGPAARVARRILLANLRAIAGQLEAWTDETRVRQCPVCLYWTIVDDTDRRTLRRRYCGARCRRRAQVAQRRLPLEVDAAAG
jgi:hypothetical protein